MPLFLHYSRHGHFVRIRKVAIDAIILIDGFKTNAITKYLGALILNDPDLTIRYSISRSIFNFSLIIFHIINTGLYPESQKQSFLVHLNILCDMFSKASMGYYLTKFSDDFNIGDGPMNYIQEIHKIKNDLVANIEIANRPKIVLKIPTVVSVSTGDKKSTSVDAKASDAAIQKQRKPPVIPTPKPVKPKLNAEMENCRRVLRRLHSNPDSYWFHNPVDPLALGISNYMETIKNPMDFSTISKKLMGLEYENTEQFSKDVLLVFDNAMVFNMPGTVVYQAAQSLKEKFEYEFYPTESEDQLYEKIHRILTSLLENPQSLIFRQPVDSSLPGLSNYYKVIKEPMDFGMIARKVEERQYNCMAAFHADIRRIFNNCFKFNKKGTYGYIAGRDLEKAYNALNKVFIRCLIFRHLDQPPINHLKVDTS